MKLSLNSKMLVFLLFCTLCIGTHTRLSAQFIDIPDANFRAKLQTLYPACFGGVGGIQLNTTCTAVTSATALDVSATLITDLTGIGAFTSLTTLDCSGNRITSLPPLPASLITLDCGSNPFTSSPTLPVGLRTLVYSFNPLTSLPSLPAGLQRLECRDNKLTSLPTLPTGLTYLECFNNELTSIPTLPASLIYLSCGENQLTSLPALPASLIDLGCPGNKLTSLPSLPTNLSIFGCDYNLLTSLPTLPASLTYLDCTNNRLTSLPVLPTSLIRLFCSSNQLTSLPTLPTSLVRLFCNSNQLTSLPALHVGLIRIECYNNQLTSLPTLPAGLGLLQMQNNLLDFADLELINPKPSNYTANPQHYTILPATIIMAIGGSTFSINGTVGGTLNVYKWYRNNVLIVGANSAIYTQTGFSASDIGLYRCEVTSTFGAGATNGVAIISRNVAVTTPCPTLSFTNTTAPNGVIGVPYSLNAVVTGNTAPLIYSISGFTGLSIDTSTGLISGSPRVPGSLTYTVTATQNNGACSITQAYTFVATCPTNTISFTNTTAPNGVVGVPYSFSAAAPGATDYDINTVPAGLVFNTLTGLISGIPTTPTSPLGYSVGAYVGDCTFITRTYTIGITCPTLTFTNTTAPGGTVGTIYSFSVIAPGATSYSINPTILPAGLSFSTSTGLISGTPSAVTASVSYTVTASAGTCTPIIQGYTFGVTCPVITFTNTTAPSGMVGTPYSFSVGASGASAYTISPATLPSGLLFDTSTGLISGTPLAVTASASYTVTATTTPNSCVGTRVYSLTIVQNPTTALDNTLANLVKVSPNPSSGDFNVDFGGINMAKSSVRVYDAQGKTVFSAENNKNLMVIPLEKFASGIYLLEVKTSKGSILKRLAKQ